MSQIVEFIILLVISAFGSSYGVIVGGGGLVKYPVLLLLGFPPALALGNIKLSLFFEDISGVVAYQRKGLINWRLALILSGFGLPLAVLGATVVLHISTGYLSIVIAILLTLLLFLIPKIKDITSSMREVAEPVSKKNLYYAVPIFLLLFFYEGFYGISFTTFMIFAFLFLLDKAFLEAVATVRAVALVLTFASSLVFLAEGVVDFSAVLPLSLGAVIGSQIGVYAFTEASAKKIRIILQLSVIASVIRLVYGAFA